MKLRLLPAALAALALAIASGCASGADTGPAPGAGGAPIAFEKKSSPIKIGYSIYDLQDPYFQSYLGGVRTEAANSGIEVVSADQKSSEQEQVSTSANLISQGISALIISPIQPDALPATISAAHAARIPVIVGDVGARGDYDTYIESNNPGGGTLAADYLIKRFSGRPGTHKVAIVGNQPGVVAGAERARGFKEQLATAPNMQLVGEIAGQTIEAAYKAGQDLLSANPDLAAVYATNSNNVQGVSRAAATAGRPLTIVGFNGDPVELDLIAQGKETATVAQDPFGQGQTAVRSALALLDGRTPPFTEPSTKTIRLDTRVVDAANLAEYRRQLQSQK